MVSAWRLLQHQDVARYLFQPKLKIAPKECFSKVDDWRQHIAGIVNDAGSITSHQVVHNLWRAAGILAERHQSDYWRTDAGQIEPPSRIQDESGPPGANRSAAWAESGQWKQKTGIGRAHISELDYAAASKAACLGRVGPASEEWIEVELVRYRDSVHDV